MDLKNIDIEDLKNRIGQLSKEYCQLTNELIPLLQKASNIEHEMRIISEELLKRNGDS